MQAQPSRFLSDFFSTGLILSMVFFLVSCGSDSEPASHQSLKASQSSQSSASDCGAETNFVEARLGKEANFMLSPKGATAPFKLSRESFLYFADSSGGTTFAKDSFPLQTQWSTGTLSQSTQILTLNYSVRSDLANQEARYASMYPGRVLEFIKIVDASGKSYECALTTTLSP